MLGTATRQAGEKKVSWFELFYDLVIVAAVGHGSEVFGESPTWATGSVIGASVFVLFVVWLLTTLSHGAFPGDSPARRGLVLLQMLALSVAALSVGDRGLPTDMGFFALGVVFASISGIWVIAGRGDADRGALAVPVILGSGVGAGLIVLAGILPGDDIVVRVVAGLGVLVAAVPAFTIFLSRAVPGGLVNSHHLEERLALFILIMLGESFAHLIGDLASLEEIPNPVFFVLTFIVVFAIWTLYLASISDTHLPTSVGALRGWLAAHLILAFGAVSVAASFADITLIPLGSTQWSERGTWTSMPLAYVLVAMLILAVISHAPRSIVWAHALALTAVVALVLVDLLVLSAQTRWIVGIGAAVVIIDASVVTAIRRSLRLMPHSLG